MSLEFNNTILKEKKRILIILSELYTQNQNKLVHTHNKQKTINREKTVRKN